MMNKVYCKDCRYHRVLPLIDLCGISEESDDEIPESYNHPAYIRKTKRNPFAYVKNRNNDCQDFGKKLTLIIWEKIKSWVK